MDIPRKRVEECPPAVFLEEWEEVLTSDAWVAEEKRQELRHEFWQTLGVYCYGKVARNLWKPMALTFFSALCLAALGRFVPDTVSNWGVGFGMTAILVSLTSALWGLADLGIAASRLISKRISSLYWTLWVQKQHNDGLYLALAFITFLVTLLTLLVV